MNGGTAADTDGGLYANWGPSGVWQGLLSSVYVDGLYGQGDDGDYWSSTAVDTGTAFGLYFGDGYVGPAGGNDLNYGYAVRCLI